MMSTLERVLVLKSVPIFAELPDRSLREVAAAVEELRINGGDTIFEKGDAGTEMFVIVSGGVRVHDGDQTVDQLTNGDVFGEMALLDVEPRMASVTAEEDALLLRLNQDAFYELLEDHSEVARGIIQVLSRRLRERVEDLRQLKRESGTN